VNEQDVPPIVEPAPVPLSHHVGWRLMTDGTRQVVLTTYSPTGQHVQFLSTEGAKLIAKALNEAAGGLAIVTDNGSAGA
jgi:hypothetical protein